MTDKIYPIGRIYKLISDNGLAYIGSTNRTLSKRLVEHKSCYKLFEDNKRRYISSSKLFEDDGIVSIELLEEHANISKFELQVREKFYIENNDCVNNAIPTQTIKEWIEKNKDKITAYKKEYYEANKEKKTAYQKEYYEANKDTLKAYRKEHYEANKDTLKAKHKGKILCDRCKCEIVKSHKSRHQKTAKCNNITINITGNSNIINLNK